MKKHRSLINITGEHILLISTMSTSFAYQSSTSQDLTTSEAKFRDDSMFASQMLQENLT